MTKQKELLEIYPTEGNTTHIKRLETFLRHEFTVCTPGITAVRAGKVIYADVTTNMAKNMQAGIKRFLYNTDGENIFICTLDKKLETNKEASIFFEKVRDAIYKFIERRLVTVKNDTLCIYRPNKGMSMDTLFTFLIGPHYEQPHGRYAPTTAVVFTWVSDTDAVYRSKKLIKNIRDNLAELNGPTYDNGPFVRSEKCPWSKPKK